jgi:hypothetical protein
MVTTLPAVGGVTGGKAAPRFTVVEIGPVYVERRAVS